jgi:hypothetical protein
MTSFPDDWPEDAKAGPKFLAELMRRFPASIQTGTLTDAEKWIDREQPKDDRNGNR